MEINRVLHDPKEFLESFVQIESKNKDIIPFILNDIQNSYMLNSSYRGQPFQGQRDLNLKARQFGFTTLKLGEYFQNTITHKGTNTVIVSHEKSVTEKLLEKVKLMYNSLPDKIKRVSRLKYNNVNELWFRDLNSRIIISTLGKGVGRGETINNLLCTEVAFWKDAGKIMHGLTEAVPFYGNITIESTPNMMGGYYYDMVDKAMKLRSAYKLHVYPWYLSKEYSLALDFPVAEMIKFRYNESGSVLLDEVEINLIKVQHLTLEQIFWRRHKMLELGDLVIDEKTGIHRSQKFSQEYECNFVQGGRPWIDEAYIRVLAQYQLPIKGAKYTHGVDTSEGIDKGDECAMVTLSMETGDEVGSLRGLWRPQEFALKIHNQCKAYGGLLGIEVNNTGLAVIERVTDLWEEEYGEFYRTQPEKVKYWLYVEKKRIGWYTSGASRTLMFVDGEEALRNQELKIAKEDVILKKEIVACQYDDNNIPKAPEGATDHTIIALLIAWQMRKHYNQIIDTDSRKVTMRVIGN